MRHILIITIVLIALSVALRGQQLTPRVAGLEYNAAYMELLGKQQLLKAKEDSINAQLTAARADLRDKPDQRAVTGARILQLESAVFDVRSEIGAVSGKINSIEQEYILSNLGAPAIAPAEPTTAATDMASYVQANLSPQDLEVWRKASAWELPVSNFIKIYLNNYATMSRQAAGYAVESTEQAADSIMALYRQTEKTNAVVEDTIAKLWHYVFDNKTYLCNLLMDKAGNIELLEQTEARAAALRTGQATLKGRFTSDAVGFYRPEKSFLLGTEIAVAQWLGDQAAVDSLTRARKAVEALADPLRISLEPRSFIAFEDVKILPRTPYSAANPIPEPKEYSHGTLYRVLLGAYLKPQSPAIFRNAAPLSVMRGADGKYMYFAGCLPTEGAAADAVATLKKAGFRAPEAVVWKDGEYLGPVTGEAGAAAAQHWKVEVVSTEASLSTAVKDLVTTLAQGREVSRTASTVAGESRYLFTIGTWEDKAVAATLAEAIRNQEPALAVTVTEVPPANPN